MGSPQIKETGEPTEEVDGDQKRRPVLGALTLLDLSPW